MEKKININFGYDLKKRKSRDKSDLFYKNFLLKNEGSI